MMVVVGVMARVGIWCYAPPPVPGTLHRVGRTGPLLAGWRRPGEEKGRIRESEEKRVRLVDDSPEEWDRTGRVVA